ncbi:hypothetical protein [Streptomyces sp. NPDC059168]|uniref:hypothetical protein n=1 Tax=Streptomyces sp. NPDC059168 TaxID=3346753 RepID=UPI003697DD0E
MSVEEEEYQGEAWIWIPGVDVRQLDLEESEDAATMSPRSSGIVQMNASGSAQVYQGGVEPSRR